MNKNTLMLPDSINKKLLNYSLTSAAILLFGKTADAQVWGFDVNPDAVLSSSGEFLDINFNGNVAFRINNAATFSFDQVNINYQTASAQWINRVSSLGGVKALNNGYSVRSTAPSGWINNRPFIAASNGTASSGAPFLGTGDKFIGVRFKISGNYHYGWILVNVASDASTITIKSYAYDQTAGNPIIADGVLPVELTNFSAINQNNGICLNWATSTEVNNYGFEIERLKDSKIEKFKSWEKIGFIKGAGNSSSEKVYSFVDQSPLQGDVLYRLKQIDNDGKFTYSKELLVNLASPLQFTLGQNYPNPFNPVTNIHFTIPESGEVTLKVYNSIGEEVASLLNNFLEAGIYSVDFKGENLSSGVYIYRLNIAGKFSAEKKMNLVK